MCCVEGVCCLSVVILGFLVVVVVVVSFLLVDGFSQKMPSSVQSLIQLTALLTLAYTPGIFRPEEEISS